MGSDVKFWNVRLFGGRVVIPHALEFEDGGVWDVPPFRVLDAKDPTLAVWLEEILADRSSPKVVKDADPKVREEKQFLRVLGAKSRKDYYSGGRAWSVEREGSNYRIFPWVKSTSQQGFVVDVAARDRLKDLSFAQVVEYLLTELVASAERGTHTPS